MRNIICIYHGNCMDGFTSAWVVRKYYADFVDVNLEFHAGVYQTPPPDVTGKDVILVDFSYKSPVLEEMLKVCNSMLIIDHHKSAIEDINNWADNVDPFWGSVDILKRLATYFDIKHSGAMLTWDYFFPTEEAPMFIHYVQDRDLWNFNLSHTREIVANIFSYPYDFTVWDSLIDTPINKLVADGVAIERKHHKDIAELLKVVTFRDSVLGGYEMHIANLPYIYSSDACHTLATEHSSGVGACYWDTPDGRVFSLRSTEDGPDVSEIAKKYGGGGHKHAAGFKIEWATWLNVAFQEVDPIIISATYKAEDMPTEFGITTTVSS